MLLIEKLKNRGRSAMRIAFDLDDTLVPAASHRKLGESVPWLCQFFFPEKLRPGSRELLRDLAREGHEIWIYTTSLRSLGYIRWWFRLMGVRLYGIVNQTEHQKILRSRPAEIRTLTKYPPAFGIDLLIDDLPGVAIEGQRHGFEVMVVRPDDGEWTAKVKARLAVQHPTGRPSPVGAANGGG